MNGSHVIVVPTAPWKTTEREKLGTLRQDFDEDEGKPSDRL